LETLSGNAVKLRRKGEIILLKYTVPNGTMERIGVIFYQDLVPIGTKYAFRR
jgi:hypothetical protein